MTSAVPPVPAPAAARPQPPAVAQAWRAAAAGARRAVLRRRLRLLLLAAVALPGVCWFATMLPWLLGAVVPSPAVERLLAPLRLLVAVHLAAVALALGPAVRPAAMARLGALARRYAARGERLRDLRRALVVEVALLFVQAPLATLLTGATLQWGIGFTVAVATLWVVWPLERIARAQQREGERLAAREAGDTRDARDLLDG